MKANVIVQTQTLSGKYDLWLFRSSRINVLSVVTW